MTGAYLKVRRNDKFEKIEVEHLTNEERETILKDDPGLINWLHTVCKSLIGAEEILEGLVKKME